jgi:hypothetical protein
MKTFIQLLIWLTYIWGACYTFYLFPWTKDVVEWWYVPHVFTLALVSIPLIHLSILVDEV